ncbi:MAG: dCTP deaminase [Acetobacteraceae bacterium]|nr:dCTP deaminase [Acetobacteraceae bacterium]
MILTGPEIIHNCRLGKIIIDPFLPENCNPNSYNFRLGSVLRVYDEFPLDPKRPNKYVDLPVPPEGFVLEPHRLYLGHTMEVMGSRYFAPTFAARSSVARLGLFINLSASLGDIGFIGQWTLQLFTIHPLRVYAGMKIGQIMWWKPQGTIRLYEGKYQGSSGPQSTLIYKDFERKDAQDGRRSA